MLSRDACKTHFPLYSRAGDSIDSNHSMIEIHYRNHDSEKFTITIVRILHVTSINDKLLPVYIYYSTCLGLLASIHLSEQCVNKLPLVSMIILLLCKGRDSNG